MARKSDGSINYSDFYLKNFREKPKVRYDNSTYERDDINESPIGYDNNDNYINVPYRQEPLKLKAIEPNEIDNEPYLPLHTVEYISPGEMRTQGQRKCKWRKKSPSTPKKRIRNKGIVLVILTILLCFSGTMLIADALSGGYMLNDFQAMLSGKANRIKTYYAVEMLNFTDITSARLYSDQIKDQGAGGYIINDKLYRVIAEVYSSKEDADNVCSKLNIAGYMARLYEINIDDIDYKLLPTSVRNITKSTMKYVGDTHNKLYDIGAKLATNNIDKSAALAELKTLRATLANTLTDYEANCDNKIDDPYVYKVKMQLGGVLTGIDSLCGSQGGANELLSDIRYTNTMMLYTHDILCQDWSKEVVKK